MSHIETADWSPSDLQELRQALRAVADAIANLKEAALGLPANRLNLRRLETGLRRGCTSLEVDVDEAFQAIDLLEREVPLAESFPDGSPAPAWLSPRQVLFLVKLGGGRSDPRGDVSSRRRIEQAVAGEVPLADLDAEERRVANGLIDAAISTAANATSFADRLAPGS